MAIPLLGPKARFADLNFNPLAGGLLYSYIAGTTTPLSTYTDASGAVANTNPVVLDANGYANIWLGTGTYKFILTDSLGVQQWSQDNYPGNVANGFGGVVLPVSTNTNIISTYNNSVIIASGTISLNLSPAATSGQGFIFSVYNNGTGVVTIDPSGAELINGQATLTLTAGQSVMVDCDGTQWFGLFSGVVGDGTITNTKISNQSILAHGQCKLSKSGANLLLSPFNGNKIIINNVQYAIPASGPTLAVPTLITLTSRTRTTNVATLTTSATHGRVVGDLVKIKLVGGTGYNTDIYVPITAVTTNTFSYANTGANEVPTADTTGRYDYLNYISVYNNAGVLTLQANSYGTGHTQDTNGVEIITGTPAQTLVGMASVFYNGTTWIWQDVAAQRLVRSWFNRTVGHGNAFFTTNRTTASTSYSEINTEIRNEFMTWSDERVQFNFSTSVANTNGTNTMSVTIAIDSTTVGQDVTGYNQIQGAAADTNILKNSSCSFAISALTEGYHFATALGTSTAGTSTYIGSATPGNRSSLSSLIV